MGVPTILSKGTASPTKATTTTTTAGKGSDDAQREALLHSVQAEVDEVVQVMRRNIEKAVERDGKLVHMEEKSEELRAAAERFRMHAKKVNRRMWWKNMKVRIILGAVVVIVGAVVVAVILL